MDREKTYLRLVEHYESCLAKHGDTHLGVDWPKLEDVATRYQVMLEVIRPEHRQQRVSVLDFGCGAAHLLDYLSQPASSWQVDYAGLDLSPAFIQLCRTKYPQHAFYCQDILTASEPLPVFDYWVMNGVFTEKRQMSFDEMFAYFCRMIRIAFERSRYGFAFNVMSSHVDWERDDLFHLPLDTLAQFLVKQVGRNFVIRHDYGLYEYTVYVYR